VRVESSDDEAAVVAAPSPVSSPSPAIDVDVPDQFAWTCLMYASKYGYYDIVVRLIQSGAKVNATGNCGGRTSLLLACKRGHENIVEELLKAGANVDSVDAENKTSLSWAALYGWDRIVTQLLNAGADAKIESTVGKTSALYAKSLVTRNKLEVAEGLFTPSAASTQVKSLNEHFHKLGWDNKSLQMIPFIFEFLTTEPDFYTSGYNAGKRGAGRYGESGCRNLPVRMVKVAKAEYENAPGVILEWVEEKGMFRVEFKKLGKTMKVYPGNLEVDTKRGAGTLKRDGRTGDFWVMSEGNSTLAKMTIVT